MPRGSRRCGSGEGESCFCPFAYRHPGTTISDSLIFFLLAERERRILSRHHGT